MSTLWLSPSSSIVWSLKASACFVVLALADWEDPLKAVCDLEVPAEADGTDDAVDFVAPVKMIKPDDWGFPAVEVCTELPEVRSEEVPAEADGTDDAADFEAPVKMIKPDDWGFPAVEVCTELPEVRSVEVPAEADGTDDVVDFEAPVKITRPDDWGFPAEEACTELPEVRSVEVPAEADGADDAVDFEAPVKMTKPDSFVVDWGFPTVEVCTELPEVQSVEVPAEADGKDDPVDFEAPVKMTKPDPLEVDWSIPAVDACTELPEVRSVLPWSSHSASIGWSSRGSACCVVLALADWEDPLEAACDVSVDFEAGFVLPSKVNGANPVEAVCDVSALAVLDNKFEVTVALEVPAEADGTDDAVDFAAPVKMTKPDPLVVDWDVPAVEACTELPEVRSVLHWSSHSASIGWSSRGSACCVVLALADWEDPLKAVCDAAADFEPGFVLPSKVNGANPLEGVCDVSALAALDNKFDATTNLEVPAEADGTDDAVDFGAPVKMTKPDPLVVDPFFSAVEVCTDSPEVIFAVPWSSPSASIVWSSKASACFGVLALADWNDPLKAACDAPADFEAGFVLPLKVNGANPLEDVCDVPATAGFTAVIELPASIDGTDLP